MKTIKSAWAVVREFRRAYITLNAVYYGLVVCAMIYVAFNPALQKSLLETVKESFTKGPLAVVVAAYRDGHVITAMVLTFVVNLIGGSFMSITLPSLIIPFSGLLVGGSRASMWGLLLSPTTRGMGMMMIPHSLTLILEGQAYIVAMLAAYIQGKAFLWPRTVGAASHWQGYWAGVKRSARLYLLVVIVLGVAAVYEALEVIYVVPILLGTH